MSPQAVQDILQDFANRAQRVGPRRADGSEVWRFTVDSHAYDLHYYPDDGTLIRRRIGGADAARQFAQLQAFQKLGIPATRVIANLKGFRLGDRKGDACIVVHDQSVPPLPAVLRDVAAMPYAARLAIVAGLVQRLEELHRHKLCPRPLRLDQFGQRGPGGAIVLIDGAARLGGIVDEARLGELDLATRPYTSRADRLRIWRHFTVAPVPRGDRPLSQSARRLVRTANQGSSDDFGTIAHDGWTGVYTRRVPVAAPWSTAATLRFDDALWTAAWPQLFDATRWHPIKQDDASHVLAGSIMAEGDDGASREVNLILKRPATGSGPRGWFKRLRQSRARRSWLKTWRLLAGGFPCEVPLLLLERRRGLLLVDQLVVYERVPGPTLADVDLNALAAVDRANLLAGCGRVLRRLERAGFVHADAKDTNWITWTDPAGRPRPILIDLDGVRRTGFKGRAVPRLIRSMRKHPQFGEGDVASIEAGYGRG